MTAKDAANNLCVPITRMVEKFPPYTVDWYRELIKEMTKGLDAFADAKLEEAAKIAETIAETKKVGVVGDIIPWGLAALEIRALKSTPPTGKGE